MDFHNIYVIFKEPLNIFPKDLIIMVIEMTYAKCNECGKYLVDEEFNCNDCYTYYCKFHYYVSVDSTFCINCDQNFEFKNDSIINFTCIKCDNDSFCGYKDMVNYCYDHAKGKILINYGKSCDVSGCNISGIYYDERTKKALCKKHKTSSSKLNYRKID